MCVCYQETFVSHYLMISDLLYFFARFHFCSRIDIYCGNLHIHDLDTPLDEIMFVDRINTKY